MKKFLHKITFLIALVLVGLSAKATDLALLSPAHAAEGEVFSLLEIDQKNDRLINNVKVFYNPVAEQVNVSFVLGKQTNVSIKVMDALGNEVLSLFNGPLEGGNQALTFDKGSKLNQGFYFVRVIAGSENVVKRFAVR